MLRRARDVGVPALVAEFGTYLLRAAAPLPSPQQRRSSLLGLRLPKHTHEPDKNRKQATQTWATSDARDEACRIFS